MKLKKIMLVSCLMLAFITPVSIHAESTKSIIIASKQLPYIMYIKVKDEKHMQVNFISRDLMLPISCKEKALPLKKVDLKTEFPCIRNSIEEFFNIKSNAYVYVHLNRIADDLDLPYKNINFRKLSNVTDYFGSIVDHLHISTILKYKHYIESDMGLSDYYDFYHMFKGKKVDISYSYVNEVHVNTYTLPMDRRFHKLK